VSNEEWKRKLRKKNEWQRKQNYFFHPNFQLKTFERRRGGQIFEIFVELIKNVKLETFLDEKRETFWFFPVFLINIVSWVSNSKYLEIFCHLFLLIITLNIKKTLSNIINIITIIK
jgi:hypothetical protein